MRVVDLSQPIHTGMQVFPGDPEVRLTTVATVADDGYQVASLHAGSHTGTHLDAPLHSIVDGDAVDAIDLNRLVGTARIVDCTRVSALDVVSWAMVEAQLERLEGIAMVLFRTGWSEHFGGRRYLEHPVLAPEIAAHLIEAGITVTGVDSLNPDPTLADDGQLPFHAIFLGAGGVIVENLRNLAAVTWEDPLVSVLPLPLAGGDGAPVRAVALEPGPPLARR